jgi:hypothetical protein
MLRYYPASRIKTNLISDNNLVLNGVPYKGKYYETYDGRYFTGPNPILGDNKELYKLGANNDPNKDKYSSNKKPIISSGEVETKLTQVLKYQSQTKPVSYFPKPTESDYTKGYLNRYFVKRINDNGYVTEISPEEYAKIQNGTVTYDVSFYLTAQLVWKLIGPLNTVRLSQYDIRAGIIDTNKNQVEKLNKTFLGIFDFINEDYTRFARPTK